MEIGGLAKRQKPSPGFEGKREIMPDLVEVGKSRGDPVLRPVIRNIRESSLTTMHARGQIDDAQLRAGEWFRSTYERTRMGSMAIDPSKEPVDTSGHSDPIPDRIMIAGEQLAAARQELGQPGYWIVEMVCGQGYTLEEAGQAAGGVSNRDRARFMSWLLRLSLDSLAAWKGYASGRR